MTKKVIIGIVIFVISIFGFAEGIRQYTLYSTNGECEVVGTCSCPVLEKYGYHLDTCYKNLEVHTKKSNE